MNAFALLTALLWGACCGYCGIRLVETLINLLSAIHGLFTRRWKSLVNRAMPGQIAYDILLDLLVRMLLQALLFASILIWGDEWVGNKTSLLYSGTPLWIWATMAIIAAVLALRSSWRRIVIAWKISHEFDYAQKRKRTLLMRR